MELFGAVNLASKWGNRYIIKSTQVTSISWA